MLGRAIAARALSVGKAPKTPLLRSLTTRTLTVSSFNYLTLPRRQQASRRTLCLCSHNALGGIEMADSVAGGASTKPGDATRLPTNVYPEHYELVFKTDLQSNPPSYVGEALIHLKVNESTSSLTFNVGKNLSITHMGLTSVDLKSSTKQQIGLDKFTYDAEQTRVTVDLKDIPGGGLKAGQEGVKAWFRFEAELEGSMNGYYKSEGDVDEQTGKKPIYALTQFEATDARKAFPCWDEPLVKSKFSVSMIAPENLTVLANMPDVSSKPWKAPSNASAESALSDSYELGSTLGAGYTGSAVKVSELAGKTEGQTKTEGKTEGKTEAGTSSSNLKITKFETTPLMSTYLVAFACGEFASLSSEHKSVKTGKTIPLRIFATPDAIGQAQFGLDIKKWALPVYEEIFDIPYALPKLDTLVAHDFDAGAMENWGLITGRTTAYLYDPKKSSLSAKKRVAVVQCHELAHMWFGDIVTMKWWDNLWLNEAFATLMGELVILDRIWPEWKPRSEFLNTHLTSALALDSQRSSHPIEVDCPNEDQISQIFDAISYSKGASVLRMLMGVVGEDKFLKGVSIYLKKHLYGNAQTKDLWEGISEASGIDVAKVMANWTLKTGFPVITVDESEAGKIKVTQNRFLATGDVKPEEDETIWWVPLEIKTFKGDTPEVDHKAILSDRSSTYELNGADSFKLNAETVGVYRVNYSPERLQKLGEAASSFSVEDRVGLVSDATTLARAGYGKTSGSLNLVKALGQVETENLPWAQIANALGKLEAVWWEQPEPVRAAIDKLRVELFKPVVERMGYEHAEEDSPDTKELRALAVSSAASAKDQGVLDELNSRFQPFLESNDDSQIPPDLQRTIFVNAVRYGGEKAYEKILAVYNKPANPSTKVDAMYALCSPKDEALIERTFKMLEDGSVKDQDYYIFFFGLGANHAARRKISDYFLDHYDALYKRFENSGINYLVRGSLTSFTSHEDLQRFKDFFKDKDIRRCKLAVHQAYDSIQASADWLKRDQKDVEEWLKSNKYL